MNTFILIRTSLRVFYSHPVRSLLTVLGIMIGIVAIIVTFSISQGAEQKVKSQILSLGENSLYILNGNVIEHGQVLSNLAQPAKLTFSDFEALKAQVPAIEYISPGYELREPISYGLMSAKEHLFGSDESTLIIRNRQIARGTFFNKYHVDHRLNVLVMGHELAKSLFKHDDPLGKIVRIKGIPFTVIGVLKPVSQYWGAEDPNREGFIPWTVAKKYFKKPDKTDLEMDFIAIKLGKEEIKGEGLRMLTRALRVLHNIKLGNVEDFLIIDLQSLAQSAETASEIIQLFGLLAASISLLVGGIGIMNIMLVSVQERTREIGIRLALGATQRTIQVQFLIEALTLCLLGGIMGILAGVAAAKGLSTVTSLPGAIELRPLIVSLLATFLIGIFFGYYPARQAARLNPVEALYHR